MDPFDVIAGRYNKVYKARKSQLDINILGMKGGAPYVNKRLSRFPGESKADWDGTTRKDGSLVTGRKEQSHCIPYLGRIIEKINQHVLGIRPERIGAAEDVIADITSDGESIHQFTRRLNSLITACRWAWVGLDMIDIPAGSISQADKERLKIRPYWTIYTALDVVDWRIDAKGGIQWLITDCVEEITSSPYAAAVSRRVRRLWEPGKVTSFFFNADGDKITGKMEKPLEVRPGVPLPVVPFVLVGEISSEPHQFDNLESINRTIMDLESANRSNFFKCVFPQPYCPASLLDTVKNQFNVNAEQAVAMVFGQGYPILLNQGDPTPGYMMPDAAATGTMRTEIDALKSALFEVVGLMLQQETKQVASAEAKAWDYLDVTQVMRERADLLEDAEAKIVRIAKLWDPTFKDWTPKYNRTFDVGAFKEEIEAIVLSLGVSMPQKMNQFLLKKLFERARRIGTIDVDAKEEKAILDEIATFAPSVLSETIPAFEGVGNDEPEPMA